MDIDKYKTIEKWEEMEWNSKWLWKLVWIFVLNYAKEKLDKIFIGNSYDAHIASLKRCIKMLLISIEATIRNIFV